MAATLITEPTSPASCYRPLQFAIERDDPAVNLIDEVFIADASDVSTIGNGLEVGDVVVKYSTTINGSVSIAVDQTILLDTDCGPYAGVHHVTNEFTYSGSDYAVIDATDEGDFTPAMSEGGMRIWLDNYTIHFRILIYTDPLGEPQVVDLKGQPDDDGLTYFRPDLHIRDYFSHRIEDFIGAVDGGGFVQNAHGVTALFYRIHIAEVYDVPGEDAPDPFDGEHDVEVDDTESADSFRVAVNAVHPYASSLLDWSSAGMGSFVAGSSSRKFLTNMPRTITLRRGDHFRLFILSDAENAYEVSNMEVRFAIAGVGADQETVELDDITSAFAVACGPADIAGMFSTEPTQYAVLLRTPGGTVLSETITIKVDDHCSENERTFGFLNKLGGVDQYTFAGREISTSRTKRASVRKMYGPGTGFDYTERPYRAEPERTAVVSTKPVPREVHKWLGQDFSESANTVAVVEDRVCACVLLTSDVVSGNTGPMLKPFTVEYRLGVDNLSQRS